MLCDEEAKGWRRTGDGKGGRERAPPSLPSSLSLSAFASTHLAALLLPLPLLRVQGRQQGCVGAHQLLRGL